MSVPSAADQSATGHLLPGLRFPDLGFETTAGGIVHPARTRGRTVLFVYPWSGRPGVPNPPDWDDIPGAHGSTPEVEGFRDLMPSFRAAGVEVLGLSGQSTAWQAELKQRLGVPFDFASDTGLALGAALSLPTFETGGVVYYRRLTLLLDSGCIALCIHPVLDPAGHAREMLSLVSS